MKTFLPLLIAAVLTAACAIEPSAVHVDPTRTDEYDLTYELPEEQGDTVASDYLNREAINLCGGAYIRAESRFMHDVGERGAVRWRVVCVRD
jgi:hypothetical protein